MEEQASAYVEETEEQEEELQGNYIQSDYHHHASYK
jgi:hypothetical protein